MKMAVGITVALLLTGIAAASGATWYNLARDGESGGHAGHWLYQTGLAPGAAGAARGPTAEDALTRLERLDAIKIGSREAFNPENGVRSGSGTPDDPYVFEGFYTPRMTIEDVAASYVIRDVYVAGTLRLDYTGATARVERSTIGFFLTDTNRPHEAPHTWLDVRENTMGAARIRHAGGEFSDNLVGAAGDLDPDRLALEVQGYNGLTIARNLVHGPVEFRLHGHHYSRSYEEAWMPMMGHDHGDPAIRYHEVRVSANEFRDPSGRGVAISDRDHAANHATAKSAPDPRLDLAHAHHLRFHFEGNEIRGAGLVIEKANMPHDLHTGGDTWIHARGNRILDPLQGVGIDVRGAHKAHVELDGNAIGYTKGRVDGSVGIFLRQSTGGELAVRGGSISGFERGIQARDLKDGVSWSVEGVAYQDVGREVYWDKSVKTPPKGSPQKAPPTTGHDHMAH